MMTVSDDTSTLLAKASLGDTEALGQLFCRHCDRLRRMVELRLDRRMSGRLDASDVLQEAYLECSRCLAAYLRRPELPFEHWLRLITGRRLQMLHRRHLRTGTRDLHREVPLLDRDGAVPSVVLAAGELEAGSMSPSESSVRAEVRTLVRDALQRLKAIDREVVRLRHFEMLTNAEVARLLGLSQAAASNRFVRAVGRLRKILVDVGQLSEQ